MKAVKFIHGRPGYSRYLSLEDLDHLGIKFPVSTENLVWNQENQHTIVMSNEMSDSLVEALPDEFVAFDPEEADEASEEKDVMTVDTSGTSGPPDGSPSNSEESSNDDDE